MLSIWTSEVYKLQRWFRYHGTKSLKLNKSDNSLSKIIKAFSSQSKPPRRMQTVQFYSKLYYDSRVKAIVDAEWPRVVAEAGSKGAKIPKRLKHQNSVLNRIYNSETKEFRDALTARRDAEHEEEVAAWKASKLDSGDVPKTPEEFADLSLASFFSEALSKRLGLNVAVLITGPIGDKGGRIDVKAAHAGQSRGLTPKIWPDYDPQGYKAVINSLLAFANACYSQQECDRRALPGTLQLDGLDGGQHIRSSSASRPPSPSTAGSSRPSSPAATSKVSRPLPPVLVAVVESAQKGKKPALTQARAQAMPVMPPPLRMVTSARRTGNGSSALPSLGASATSEVAGQTVCALPMTIPSPATTTTTTTTATTTASSPPAASTTSGASSTYGRAPPSTSSTASTTSLLIVLPPPLATSSRSATSSLPSTPCATSPASHPEPSGGPPKTSTTTASTTAAVVAPSTPPVTPSTALEPPATSSPPAGTCLPGPAPSSLPSPSSASQVTSSPLVGPLSKLDARNCPSEIDRVVDYLMTHQAWGALWEHCVATYVEIERFAQFEPRGTLQQPTDNRPPEVAAWMKRARKLVDFPINDVERFGDAWLSWWLNNQPDRLDVDEAVSSEVDWTILYITGPNGIRLFLLTLAWWGSVLGDDEGRDRWDNALSKVRVVLDRVLVAAAAVEAGEEAETGEVDAQPRKRRRGAGASTSNKKSRRGKQ
ncbi:hypothetical protein C8T65DRAFT_747319 [Cerioporus squamosus]|nr:hypothetical protein C8T65DRAFT_747319 [Cerioporus squamosus]